jgi:hypothetical protein
MTLYLPHHRTASIRIVKRWDLACLKFATCYILQIGPLWLSIDRTRKSSNIPAERIAAGQPESENHE